MNMTPTKLLFAWNSLTSAQQTLIKQKYELVEKIKELGERPKYGQKMKVFEYIAEKYKCTSKRHVQMIYYRMKN